MTQETWVVSQIDTGRVGLKEIVTGSVGRLTDRHKVWGVGPTGSSDRLTQEVRLIKQVETGRAGGSSYRLTQEVRLIRQVETGRTGGSSYRLTQ